MTYHPSIPPSDASCVVNGPLPSIPPSDASWVGNGCLPLLQFSTKCWDALGIFVPRYLFNTLRALSKEVNSMNPYP